MLSYDHRTRRIVTSRVRQILRHELHWTQTLQSMGRDLGLTADHLVFSVERGEYIAADRLDGRDRLLILDAEDEPVDALAPFRDLTFAGLHAVYDLEVEHPNNYFANGVLVHNKSILRPPEPTPR